MHQCSWSFFSLIASRSRQTLDKYCAWAIRDERLGFAVCGFSAFEEELSRAMLILGVGYFLSDPEPSLAIHKRRQVLHVAFDLDA